MLGLNHIPLKPTAFAPAIDVAVHAFEQVIQILRLQSLGLDIEEAISFSKHLCLSKLRSAAKANKFGLKVNGPYLFDIPAVKN